MSLKGKVDPEGGLVATLGAQDDSDYSDDEEKSNRSSVSIRATANLTLSSTTPISTAPRPSGGAKDLFGSSTGKDLVQRFF